MKLAIQRHFGRRGLLQTMVRALMLADSIRKFEKAGISSLSHPDFS